MSGYTEEYARWVKNNRGKVNHSAAANREKLRLEMVAAYGGACALCGYNADVRALHLDHKDNDPLPETFADGSRLGGAKLYWKLKKLGWPRDRFQLLCCNCNYLKECDNRALKMLNRWGDRVEHDGGKAQARVGKRKRNTSGIPGVTWNTKRNKWYAQVQIDFKAIHLGVFPPNKEGMINAGLAYIKALKDRWGSDANVQSEDEIRAAADAWYGDQLYQ